eukprot:3415134-Rhodomonas_salina.1
MESSLVAAKPETASSSQEFSFVQIQLHWSAQLRLTERITHQPCRRTKSKEKLEVQGIAAASSRSVLSSPFSNQEWSCSYLRFQAWQMRGAFLLVLLEEGPDEILATWSNEPYPGPDVEMMMGFAVQCPCAEQVGLRQP